MNQLSMGSCICPAREREVLAIWYGRVDSVHIKKYFLRSTTSRAHLPLLHKLVECS